MATRVNITKETCAELREQWVKSRPGYQQMANDVRAAEAAFNKALQNPDDDPVAFVSKVLTATDTLRMAKAMLGEMVEALTKKFDSLVEPTG